MDPLDLLLHPGLSAVVLWKRVIVWIAVILVVLASGLTVLNEGHDFYSWIRGDNTHETTINLKVSGSAVQATLDNSTTYELSDEELKNQTNELARQIFGFIGERKKTDPTYDYSWRNRNLSESQRQKEFDESNRRTMAYNDETMVIYNTKYLPEVIRIKQEFKKRNLTDPELDQFNGLQVNSMGMEMTAAKLLELTNKLP
jgi:hypothetical protein